MIFLAEYITFLMQIIDFVFWHILEILVNVFLEIQKSLLNIV